MLSGSSNNINGSSLMDTPSPRVKPVRTKRAPEGAWLAWASLAGGCKRQRWRCGGTHQAKQRLPIPLSFSRAPKLRWAAAGMRTHCVRPRATSRLPLRKGCCHALGHVARERRWRAAVEIFRWDEASRWPDEGPSGDGAVGV